MAPAVMARHARYLRALIVVACVALAGAALAQQRPPRERAAPARDYAAPQSFGRPPAYGRRPSVGSQGYGRGPMPPPADYGRARPSYSPSRYPPPGYRPGPPMPNSLGADWREQQDEARRGVRYGQMAPLGRVIENIRARTPGRQLDAGIEYLGERPVYRVRWVTDHGRRVDFLVDAATGAVLSGR